MPRQPAREWCHKRITVQSFSFTAQPGPSNCPSSLSVFDAFFLLFPLSLFSHIKEDTIHYARTELGGAEWAFSLEELFTYLSIILAMCIKAAPSINDHWSFDPLLSSPWINEKMSRAQWKEIHFFLHFDVIRIETELRTNFQYYWTPSQNVCIDEGMGPWKG
jgi:hypothetical protein